METAPSPLFNFDRDELRRLQEALPKDLQLLRLRLRFGLPVRVLLGKRFRVVVDVIDEMGQAFPKHLPPPEGVDISLVSQSSSVINNQEISSGDVGEIIGEIILKTEGPVTQRRQEAKWVFWASLHSAQGTCVLPIDIRVGLRIHMKQPLTIGGDSYHYRRLLQTFCVGSAWLDEHVLVLPLQVELQVLNTSNFNDTSLASTVCHRLFRVLPSTNSTTEGSTDEGDLLTVEEHYGDAMGAHVWDASILLSWAVLQAGARASTSPGQDDSMGKASMKQTMLELGSGCGLFAAVLARVKTSHQHTHTIFAEKSECTHRLQTNLDRNGSPPSASVLALEWGAPLPSLLRDANVRVVFAADVLYNWAAHEVFLATLDNLAQAQQSDTKLHVFVAHKRRGKASAEKLDALASGTFDPASMCGTSAPNLNCRWIQWRVDKASSLGRVDLLKLSRR